MNRTLRKAIILQNNLYRVPENRLAEYHGAIFAEEFRRHGVEATKMVLGNPDKDKPLSPLLSVSSMEQRLSPDWWKLQAADLIIFYGGLDLRNLPVMESIKQGLPGAKLILKMDTALGPHVFTTRTMLDHFKRSYIKDRHGHVNRGDHDQNNPIAALFIAMLRTTRIASKKYQNNIHSLFQVPDFISYELDRAIHEAETWTNHYQYTDLRGKFIWLGYPVRAEFAVPRGVARKAASIISVANWKHPKDLDLHAKALAEVMKIHPGASATLIGADSHVLRNMVERRAPTLASRINQIDEVSNRDLPAHLQTSEVFMLCSFTEGVCSAIIEALCCGCSVALSSGLGVPCFGEFASQDCGTQAISRKPSDMANAVLSELAAWRKQARDPEHIRRTWSRTLVPNLCEHICEVTGLKLP
jgi:glycosyltransferase involved in cell wall biosynthesis